MFTTILGTCPAADQQLIRLISMRSHTDLRMRSAPDRLDLLSILYTDPRILARYRKSSLRAIFHWFMRGQGDYVPFGPNNEALARDYVRSLERKEIIGWAEDEWISHVQNIRGFISANLEFNDPEASEIRGLIAETKTETTSASPELRLTA